jgi:D-alanyl-D-alanine carboxypeptidase
MDPWLKAALDYLPRWLEFQVRQTEQPGLSFALVHQGKPLLALACGHADQPGGVALTPRHRFRVASHSKSFTAAAVLKLRERGRLQLDDPIGRHVGGLHPQVATATVAQLLSHSAGLVRDGRDAGQWVERRPFLDEADLRADLADGPILEANTRFKYSNHGYGLLGLAIESLTGERYTDWVAREIVAASGLVDTLPDMPDTPDGPAAGAVGLAAGHSAKWPLGRRLAIPAAMNTHALSAATGFVSTASDLARFFGSLSPLARKSVLSVASRREITRRQWREPHASGERWYGLGTLSGTLGGWDWFGHTGGFPGTLTRTACVPAQGLTLSALTNAADGLAGPWVDGALQVLQAFAKHGAPSRRSAAWTGRWWSLWGAVDLLPVKDKVLVANPALGNPVLDAAELCDLRRDRDGTLRGRIVLANGFAAHGEAVSLSHDARGKARALQLAGGRLLPEAAVARELQSRYG